MSAQTIPLPDIIKKLASKVSCDDEIAGAFLKEFSTVVTQGLAADGAVNITGLGTFHVITDMEGKSTVDFAPESSLAGMVNEPFAMFESVEVADSVTDDELDAAPVLTDSPYGETPIEDSHAKESDVATEESQPTPPPLPPRFSRKVEKVEPETQKSTEPEVTQPAEAVSSDQSVPQPTCPPIESPVSVRLEPESRVTIKRVGHTSLTLVVTAIAACLFGIVIGYLAYRYANYGLPSNVEVIDGGILIRHTDPNSPVAEEIIPFEQSDSVLTEHESSGLSETRPDSLTVSPEASHKEKIQQETVAVTDTVKPGNYLSVMARRHYGNAKFWVYIYLENKDKIKDPDNLENGMVLVIPPASKYGIAPSDPESLKKADKEAYKAMSE